MTDEPVGYEESERLRTFFSSAVGYDIQGTITPEHRRLFQTTMKGLQDAKVALNILKVLWSAPMGSAVFYTTLDNLNEMFGDGRLELIGIVKSNLAKKLQMMDISA